MTAQTSQPAAQIPPSPSSSSPSSPSSSSKQAPPPPSPRRYPLVGHLPWLARSGGHIFDALLGAREHFPQGLMRIQLPNHSPTFIFSARIAAEVSDETRFHKGIRGPLTLLRDIAQDGLFTAAHGEPAWGHAHKMLVPGFTGSSMERYYPQMLEVAGKMVESWRARPDGVVDVSTDMTRLTLDTIGLCGFGERFNSFSPVDGGKAGTPGPLNPFLQALGRILAHTEDRIRQPPLFQKLQFRTQRQYAADRRTLDRVVDDVIAQRKKTPKDTWPKDFLSLMLDDGSGSTPLTDENIRCQVITFLIAGHETTSGLLSFTLHHLLRNPAELKKIREEVDAVITNDAPTQKEVLSLSATRRALMEALRLYPPALVFQMTPYEPTVVDERWQANPGEAFVVFLPAVHRDPEVWERPDAFEPDRHLKLTPEQRSAYKPFGNGKRACIGRQFALVEATLALGLMVRHFDLSDDGAPLQLLETLTIKPADYFLKATPRT